MAPSADLVLFGIQAAVKLARAARTIYVEKAVEGDVVMPLPHTLDSSFADAQDYAIRLSKGDDREKRLFEGFFKSYLTDPPNTEAVVQNYFLLIQRGEVPTRRRFYDRERAALAVLKQWDHGKSPFPSPIQRVAGTLVNIAVDYFVQVPGAINEHSKYGKTIKALLEGVDNTDFSEERFDSIIIALFTSGLDALAENPELYSDADDENDLLRVIVRGVANDLHARLPGISGPDVFDEEARLRQFGGIVLRSLLTGSARNMVANPTALGITDTDQKALFTNVGSAFLDLLLTGDVNLRKGLQQLASTGGIEKLIHAALKTAAEHPDLFKTDDAKLKEWITGFIQELYRVYPERISLFNPDLFANIAYILIDKGRLELNALLIEELGAGRGALLSEVTRQVLLLVAERPSAARPARWKFNLTQEDLLKLIEAVAMALAGHPEWLLEKPANRAIAAEGIPYIIEVLTQLGEGGEAHLFKALLRSDRMEPLLVAILSSGLLEKLRKADHSPLEPQKVARSIHKSLNVITREGFTGLDRVLAPAQLHDLLMALAESRAVGLLFPDHVDKADKVLMVLAIEVSRMRRGEIAAVPEITRSLDKAAA